MSAAKYWFLVSFFVMGWRGVTASCGGISSVMGKFSILPYFFLRLFGDFLGIREQRRRGEGEESSERLSALLQTNAFGSIPPL